MATSRSDIESALEGRPALLEDACRRALRYLAGLADRPVAPSAGAVSALRGFDFPLPAAGRDPAEVVALLDEVGSPATVASAGPRYFGFVTGGTLPVAQAAGWLASAWDQNAALSVMSPAATALDAVALRWVTELLGLTGRIEPTGGWRRVPVTGRGVIVVGRHRKAKTGDRRQLGLRAAGAMLLAVSACIHLGLYLTGYRSIPTIGWLFLLQFTVAFVLAAGALVTHSRLAAAAGAAFALSTLGFYLLAVWIGLFGFKEVRTRAGIAAGLIEVAAFGTLALAAFATDAGRQWTGRTRPGTRLLAGARAAASTVIAGVGGVSVAALVLFGVAVASAAGPPAAAAGGKVTLKAVKIGSVTVLTNPQGLTLYWFAPDTPTTSMCTGSCAAYWPPVSGSPKAGPGITGRLGTIKRPGGGVQATYDGHPLYTYIGDSGPGQAKGNKLDLNGGFWYEVPVSG